MSETTPELTTNNSTTAFAEDDLRNELIKRFKTANAHVAKWQVLAKEDYKFSMGEQWTSEERTRLEAAGRPALTFNRILPLVNLISGYQRENSSRIKVNPEGGEDRIFSEIMDKLVTQIGKWAHLPHKMGYWFDDGLRVGKGWLEAVLVHERDPIRGDLDFQLRTPYQVLSDPDSTDYDLNGDARYVFKVVRLSKEVLLDLYPAKANLIRSFKYDNDDFLGNGEGILKEGSDDDYGNRPNATTVAQESPLGPDGEFLSLDEKFTVKEYWRTKSVTKYYVVDREDGEPRKFDDQEAAAAFVTAQGGGEIIERDVSEMWVAAMAGGWILNDERSPFEPHYSGFPFFRFIADWSPNAEDEEHRVQGIVRSLKDPQREKNKAKSQYLHILNTQANSGWVGDKDALTDQGWRDLEAMGSKPGIAIKKKRGAELREIAPKGPSTGQLVREEKAEEEFTQISGINPDLLGFQDKTTSGRAISLRIKQAVMSLVRLFANYRYSKEILGLFLLKMIPATFDVKKVQKVLGTHYLRETKDETLYPDGLSAGHLRGILQLVTDQRYDVYVSEADQNQTMRFETLDSLTELVKAGMPIPPDLLIEYMDLPNSKEVQERVAAYAQQVAAAQQSAK